MATSHYTIEIRITGENLNVNQIRSSDVASVISSTEKMILSILERDFPDIGIAADDIILSLASVREGSLVLEFRSPYQSVEPAYKQLTDAVRDRRFDALPTESVEALREIRKFSKRYIATTELWQNNGTRVQLAELNYETPIETTENLIRGSTTLYGKVIQVSGEPRTRVKLRLLDGSRMWCEIRGNRSASERLTLDIAQRMLAIIGVRGIGFWEPETMRLQKFEIRELTPYRERPISDRVKDLADILGNAYGQVSDMDAFVAEARGNGSGGVDLDD